MDVSASSGSRVAARADDRARACPDPPPAVPAGPLTLEQVLTLAEPRSEAVSIAQAGIRRAEGEQVRARSGGLPQLSAAASYDRALASEFEGVFDTARDRVPAVRAEPAGADRRTRRGDRARDRLRRRRRRRSSEGRAPTTAAASKTCRSAARTPGAPRCRSRRTCIQAAGSARRRRSPRSDTRPRIWR